MSDTKSLDSLASLTKELDANGIKVYAKKTGADLLLLCIYADRVKNKPNDGMEIWGRGQAIVERISSAVFRYFPKAETSSQVPNNSIVYKLNIN